MAIGGCRFTVVLVLVVVRVGVESWNLENLEEIVKNADNIDVVFPYALTEEGSELRRRERSAEEEDEDESEVVVEDGSELRRRKRSVEEDDEEPEVDYEDGSELRRRKRSVEDGPEGDVDDGDVQEGDVEDASVFVVKEWILELQRNTDLVLGGGLEAEWVDAAGDVTREAMGDEMAECRVTRGRVRGEEDSMVALTLCRGEMTGLIQTNQGSYFIQPIDGGLKLNPHLIYKAKEQLKFSLKNDQDFSENLNRNPQVFHTDGNLEKVHENIDGTTKYLVFGSGGDGSVDLGRTKRESYWDRDHIQEKTGNESYRDDLSHDRNGLDGTARFNLTSFNMEPRYDIDADEDGYFVDPFWEKETKITRDNAIGHAPPRWLEIALAADFSVIAFHTKERVHHYMLVLMNIVSAIYKDSSLASNLKLVIVRMLLYEDKRSGVVTEGNSKRSLESVNRWNERLLSNSPHTEKHDIAVWLTRLDLGGPSGYAPVSGACDPARSCTLNRDEGLTSSFIIAHEMAHVLGLTHDGDDASKNDCGREARMGSVMAPMVAATFHRFTWSSCSKREFHTKASLWRCLANPPRGSNSVVLKSTLQATFSMDEQCRMEFGNGYSLCRSIDLLEPCTHLWCGHHDTPLVCKTKKGPPLEGTECGVDKWCVNGYCEVVDRRRFGLDPVIHNPRDGGWTSWSVWTPCSRSCGVGVAFRTRKCENPRPAYGGSNCVGRSEEFHVCSTQACPQPHQDVRAQQCSRLPALVPALVPLMGPQGHRANQTWLPHEPDPESQKCQLICVSQETGEVLLTGENLLDGTACSYDKDSDICIQGECQSLGCDGVLDSTLERDSCGICGGNNSHCLNVTALFARRLRRPTSRVLVIPKMARNVRIEANVTFLEDPKRMSSIKLAMRDRRRRFYELTSPEDRNDPRDQEPRREEDISTANVVVAGARFHYRRQGSKETLWARGPLLAELVVVMAGAEDADLSSGVNVSVASVYTVEVGDPGLGGAGGRHRWQVGGWGSCSRSCGGGRKVRTIACRDTQTGRLAPRRYCPLAHKPQAQVQTCNTFSCEFQWATGEWEHCSTTCGSRGVQQRSVFCMHGAATDAAVVRSQPWRSMVNPSLCTAALPELSRPCNRVPCPVHWTPGNWSECSATCGLGVQTREPRCPVPRAEPLFDCGPSPATESRTCRSNRRWDPLCWKPPVACRRDASRYCRLTQLLGRYCTIPRFGELCCISCEGAQNQVSHLTDGVASRPPPLGSAYFATSCNSLSCNSSGQI